MEEDELALLLLVNEIPGGSASFHTVVQGMGEGLEDGISFAVFAASNADFAFYCDELLFEALREHNFHCIRYTLQTKTRMYTADGWKWEEGYNALDSRKTDNDINHLLRDFWRPLKEWVDDDD